MGRFFAILTPYARPSAARRHREAYNMAAITSTTLTGSGARTATETTIGASDTFTFNGGILLIRNDTAGALTPNLVGDGATTVGVPGIGNVDVSTGYTAPSIAIGEDAVIPLLSVGKYLTGVVTVTGGDGATAILLES